MPVEGDVDASSVDALRRLSAFPAPPVEGASMAMGRQLGRRIRETSE
jgi:hypothetical protein